MKTKTPRIAHLINTVKGVHAVAASTAPNPADSQTIILQGEIKIDGFDGSENCVLYLYAHGCNGKKKEITLYKAMKFKSHAPHFGWGMDWDNVAQSEKVNLQTALAICIELYGVSNALKCYRDFATKYIEPLPFGRSFTRQLTVQL